MSENRNITTRGIVIARGGLGEGNLRISLYAEGLGLVAAVLRSGREERSQLRPHLQEGTHGVFTLVRGREMWRVTGVVDARNLYFSNLEKPFTESAARVLGMVRQFVHGEGNNPYLFVVLSEFLTVLPRLAEDDVKHAECLVVLRMLSALGYVQNDGTIKNFLGTKYDSEMFHTAGESRALLVRTINEGIVSSDLS